MAISKFPADFSVEPIFTLSIEQTYSVTDLPSPLPPGNYRIDTSYAAGTIGIYFQASDDSVVEELTLDTTSTQSAFFSLSSTVAKVMLINPDSAINAIVTVELLKRGKFSEVSNYPWYEVPYPASATTYIYNSTMQITDYGVYHIGRSSTTSWNTSPADHSKILKWDGDFSSSFSEISPGSASFTGGVCYSVRVGNDIYFTSPYSGALIRLYKLDTSTDTITVLNPFPSGYEGNLGGLVYNAVNNRIYKFASWSAGTPRGACYYDVTGGTFTTVTQNPANSAYGSFAYQTASADLMILKPSGAGGAYAYSASADTYTSVTAAIPDAYQGQMGYTPSASVLVHPEIADTSYPYWNIKEYNAVTLSASTPSSPPAYSVPGATNSGVNHIQCRVSSSLVVIHLSDLWLNSSQDGTYYAIPASLCFDYWQ